VPCGRFSLSRGVGQQGRNSASGISLLKKWLDIQGLHVPANMIHCDYEICLLKSFANGNAAVLHDWTSKFHQSHTLTKCKGSFHLLLQKIFAQSFNTKYLPFAWPRDALHYIRLSSGTKCWC